MLRFCITHFLIPREGYACMPGYEMEFNANITSLDQVSMLEGGEEILELKCKSLFFENHLGQDLDFFVWKHKGSNISLKKTLPVCKRVKCPKGVSLKVNKIDMDKILQWRNNRTSLKFSMTKKFLKRVITKKFITQKSTDLIASNFKTNGWTLLFQFNKPLNSSFTSILRATGRHIQVLDGSKAIAFSSDRNHKDLLGIATDDDAIFTVRMKFNKNEKNMTKYDENLHASPIMDLNVEDIRLFDHSYKNLSCLFNDNVDSPVKILGSSKEPWEMKNYLSNFILNASNTSTSPLETCSNAYVELENFSQKKIQDLTELSQQLNNSLNSYKEKDCGRGDHLFTLPDGNNTCEQNSCVCQNGTPINDLECVNHKVNICQSCDAGYHQLGDNCVINQCTCLNGTAVTGADCPHDQDHLCKRCDAGFHKSGDGCLINQCTCLNGTAEVGVDCPNHDDHLCQNCEKNYKLNLDTKLCDFDWNTKEGWTPAIAIRPLDVVAFKYSTDKKNLAEAKKFCNDLGGNLGTIRDEAELHVINEIVTDEAWVDVTTEKAYSGRSEWKWGNGGGEVSADDSFWYSSRYPASQPYTRGIWYHKHGHTF